MSSRDGVGLGRRALLNAAQLGGSLLLTWTLSLVGRFLLPNLLGREEFGQLAFIEGIAVLTMAVMAFGVADYVRKEVSVDRRLGQRIIRPVRWIQILAGLVLTALFGLAMLATSGSEQALVAVAFGLAQMTIVLGQMDSAYLQAVHEVRAVSVSNIATKIVWFIVLIAILGAGAELLALPVALLVSETIRVVWLQRAVRKEFGVGESVPVRELRPVLYGSVPHFFNALNVLFLTYSIRIIVGLFSSKDAVGLLSTAELGVAVPLLLTPVLGWVSVPYLAALRGGGPSEDDEEPAPVSEEDSQRMWTNVRQVVDLLTPGLVAVGIALFAVSDPVMELLFSEDFATAGPAFAFLALAVPLTYFTQLVGGAFIADDRSWQNTKVNLYTMLFVVVGVTIALAIGDASAGEYATRAAAITAVGEALTVAALIVLRPFGRLRRATMVRVAVLTVAFVLASIDKVGDGSTTLIVAATAISVVVAVSDVPRLLTQGRDTLRRGRATVEDPEATPG